MILYPYPLGPGTAEGITAHTYLASYGGSRGPIWGATRVKEVKELTPK